MLEYLQSSQTVLGGWEDYVWPFVAGDLIKIESTPSNYGNYKITRNIRKLYLCDYCSKAAC